MLQEQLSEGLWNWYPYGSEADIVKIESEEELTMGTMVAWLFIAVLAAIGNAGVPMGCYFLTLSLMSSIGAPIGLLGIILPIYTIIDMIETAENVWSDASVCAMVDHDLQGKLDDSSGDDMPQFQGA